jgi:coenzyme Q-binding protein COQ10
MLSYRVERLFVHRPEQVFDLVADVERYPEFLRWWKAARVRKRESDAYYTDQTLGLGPIRATFGSKTILRRPERINVTSNEAPFRHFRLSWVFEPQPEARCRVILVTEFELRSLLLQRLLDRVAPLVAANIIAAFEARAALLYESAERGL